MHHTHTTPQHSLGPHPPYMACPARGDSSRKGDPASSRASMRSRGSLQHQDTIPSTHTRRCAGAFEPFTYTYMSNNDCICCAPASIMDGLMDCLLPTHSQLPPRAVPLHSFGAAAHARLGQHTPELLEQCIHVRHCRSLCGFVSVAADTALVRGFPTS